MYSLLISSLHYGEKKLLTILFIPDHRGEPRGNSGGPPNSRSGQGNYRSDNRSHDSRRPSER